MKYGELNCLFHYLSNICSVKFFFHFHYSANWNILEHVMNLRNHYFTVREVRSFHLRLLVKISDRFAKTIISSMIK